MPLAVLNAFRHQRGIHSRIRTLMGVVSVCSTPFGIKEGFTEYQHLNTIEGHCAQRLSAWHQRGIHPYPTSQSFRRNGVLNAFRHQRGIHKQGDLKGYEVLKCSTPFGIKEGFTCPPP